MPDTAYTSEEIADLGDAIYARQIEQTLTPEDKGRFVVIDIETGDYEIDDSDLAATKRAMARRPGALLYGLRVGYPAAHRIGFVPGRTAAR